MDMIAIKQHVFANADTFSESRVSLNCFQDHNGEFSFSVSLNNGWDPVGMIHTPSKKAAMDIFEAIVKNA